MPRREIGLDERPEHLRVFCEALRDVRRQSGLTLKQLSVLTHFAESTLSRVTNALVLPPWPQVEAFLIGCGGGDLERWRELWEATKRQHELFLSKGVNERPTPQFGDGAAAQTTALQRVMTDDRPRTLSAFLQRAETAQDLIRAVRLLGERTGTVSLRQMEERCRATNVRIAKSTIRDWLAGERRPTRLDALVTALGATPAEQRHFAQCLERVWSQNPPIIQLVSRPVFTALGTKRGRHCCVVRVAVYDRSVESGMVMIEEPAEFRHGLHPGILGLSVGPTHSPVATVAPVPKTNRRGEFEIGIWVTSPAEVSDQQIQLELQLKTSERVWPARLQLQLPTYRPAAELAGGVARAVLATSPELDHLVNVAELTARAVAKRTKPVDPETAARAEALRRSRPSPAAAAAASVRMVSLADVVAAEPESYKPKHRKDVRSRGLLARLFNRSDSD